MKAHSLKVLFLLTLSLFLFASFFNWSFRPTYKQISPGNSFGFEITDCWFQSESDWPRSDCYYLHVPENHTDKSSALISFPVIVFRSNATFASKSPVLHLGAGGPGAPMYLDSTASVETIWRYHDQMSLRQGRDLFVIDPRGTGLSQPLLTCDTFVDNEQYRLQENLPLIQTWQEVDKDYLNCITKFHSQGVNLANYNSLAIARDVEAMRKAAKVDQWVLVGVSYAATYAQIIANEYPSSVETMILDSSTFPNIRQDNNYIERTLSPYRALYNHCNETPDCSVSLPDIKQRIWQLHTNLNLKPIETNIAHPDNGTNFRVTLNGERFLAAIMEGLYGETIFHVLPQIVIELERGESKSLTPYIESHVAYLLDRSYGDVSANSHYCYEDGPFTDLDLIRQLTEKLPQGYIRNTAQLSVDWPDYCDAMKIPPGDPKRVATEIKTDIPTLFLHGELDTVTPLSDVLAQQSNFSNSHLVTYPLSHDILSSDECAEFIAAKFINNNRISSDELDCS